MPAKVLSRMICLVYEILILMGLGILAGLPFVYLTDYPHHPELRSWYRAYLLLIIAIYFIYQWQRSGQTVPMKTWRLKIVDQYSNAPPTYLQSIRRFSAACCGFITGINFIWLVLDKQHRGLHDIIGGTRTIELLKTPPSDSTQ
jgi:uncharacterized RDD family membrane protein YckC